MAIVSAAMNIPVIYNISH